MYSFSFSPFFSLPYPSALQICLQICIWSKLQQKEAIIWLNVPSGWLARGIIFHFPSRFKFTFDKALFLSQQSHIIKTLLLLSSIHFSISRPFNSSPANPQSPLFLLLSCQAITRLISVLLPSSISVDQFLLVFPHLFLCLHHCSCYQAVTKGSHYFFSVSPFPIFFF